MQAHAHPWNGSDERRKNMELRVLIDFITDFYVRSHKNSWDCISETYADVVKILHQDKAFHIPDKLLAAFDANKREVEMAFNPAKRTGQTGVFIVKQYAKRLAAFAAKFRSNQKQAPARAEDEKLVQTKYDEFLRQFVIQRVEDHRVLLLVLLAVIYRRLYSLSPDDLRTTAAQISAKLQSRYINPERAMSLLIYEMCQSSVNAMDVVDYAKGMRMCEHAIEIYRMLPDDPIRAEIRTQIGETMRVTSERLVNRIQEKEQDEEIRIIEDLAGQLVNPDVLSYLLPQLVYFLIRAQRYEECLSYLDRLLDAVVSSGEFMDYQTANTIGHYWCDALLKAERYSRGQVDFSYIQREKDNIQKVYTIISKVRIPPIEDETSHNVEVEKLAVTYSHLGTLFFQTENFEMAAQSYAKSFDTILTKRCSRNRDSVDEILDRYKDTLFHPLNTAPEEAHPLIGLHASEKGYDFLLESQIKKFENEGIEFQPESRNFEGLVNEQKQLIADLMDSTRNKLKHSFSERYTPFKPLIKNEFERVREKMKIVL